MALDIATAIIDAIPALAGIAQPYINDAIAQKYENQFNEGVTEWNNLVGAFDPSVVHPYVMQLIGDCGQAVGSMGDNKSVPVGIINALILIALKDRMDNHLLANVQFKQNTPEKA